MSSLPTRPLSKAEIESFQIRTLFTLVNDHSVCKKQGPAMDHWSGCDSFEVAVDANAQPDLVVENWVSSDPAADSGVSFLHTQPTYIALSGALRSRLNSDDASELSITLSFWDCDNDGKRDDLVIGIEVRSCECDDDQETCDPNSPQYFVSFNAMQNIEKLLQRKLDPYVDEYTKCRDVKDFLDQLRENQRIWLDRDQAPFTPPFFCGSAVGRYGGLMQPAPLTDQQIEDANFYRIFRSPFLPHGRIDF